MPVPMSSERFIRAERKNRLENYRLKVTCKHYDKETVRLNYDIDREKRSITKAFRSVIKTSGASDLGIPPKNENDTDFEKCPSYMQGLKLSNKRLLEWRDCEKQLNKFIENHEMERQKQRRKKVIKKANTDYTIIPPKRFDDPDDDVFLDDTNSIAGSDKVSPIDLLKDNPDDKTEPFDIKKWEADLIESYKTSVCKHPVIEQNGDAKSNLRSKSSPTFSTRTTEFEGQQKKKVRPHTAQARLRPPSGRSSIPNRPASATVNRQDNQSKFLITKDSTYIKTGQHFEKLIDNRPVDKPLMVNNYLTSLKPPSSSLKPPSSSSVEKEPSIASVGTLCPVEEGNEDDVEGYETTDGHSELAHGDTDDNVTDHIDQEERPEYKEGAPSMLSMKFQKLMKKKLLRARSANAALGGHHGQQQNKRNAFKHSNSDISSLVRESSRRQRHDSESMSSMVSMPMSRTGSIVSSHRPSVSLGISADIDEFSRGQDKLASEITPEKPLSTNKLVSISKVVRAALTFSRVARKRVLTKMQKENSSDSHEIIRQERLRKLQSRQNVLNSIASQWQRDPALADTVTIEQVE